MVEPLAVTLTRAELSDLVRGAVTNALAEHLTEEAVRPELVGGVELARLLGVSRATVHRLRCRGMPALRILDTYRFRVAECLAWLQSRDEKGSE